MLNDINRERVLDGVVVDIPTAQELSEEEELDKCPYRDNFILLGSIIFILFSFAVVIFLLNLMYRDIFGS